MIDHVPDHDSQIDAPYRREWDDEDRPSLTEDGEPIYRRVNCSRCGKPTSYDPIYGDLCGNCCRAENE